MSDATCIYSDAGFVEIMNDNLNCKTMMLMDDLDLGVKMMRISST